jgi:hypothetical protein
VLGAAALVSAWLLKMQHLDQSGGLCEGEPCIPEFFQVLCFGLPSLQVWRARPFAAVRAGKAKG